MEFKDVILNRYSVRSFKEDIVKKEELKKIVNVARWAPSAKNHQPYKIFCIQDKNIINKLRKDCVSLFNANTVLVFAYNLNECWKNKRENGKPIGDIDVTIFATYVMLAAYEEGIGSCMVGAFDKKLVNSILGLEDCWIPILLMPIGYPAENSLPLKGFHEVRKNAKELIDYISND